MSAGQLEIDGLVIPSPGCIEARDLGLLLSGSAQRGADRLVPGSPGVVANPRRATITDVPFPVVIRGRRSFAGARHADAQAGLALNIAHLRKYAADPLHAGDGTRLARLTWRDLTPLEKPVHVEGFEVTASEGPSVIFGVLFLSFPEGLFDLADLI